MTPPNKNDDLVNLPEGLIGEVASALEQGDQEKASDLIRPLHYADTADLIEQLPSDLRLDLIDLPGEPLEPEALSALDERVREEVIDHLEPEALAAVVHEMASDDAVDLIEDLDEGERQEVLEALPEGDRALIEESLTYPEFSAGRLMSHELVAVPEFWSVGECIDHLRAVADQEEGEGKGETLPEDFYDIYVVDPRHHPVGTVALNRLLRSRRAVALSDILQQDTDPVPAATDQEEVAYLFSQRDLVSAPVVDDNGRLVGTITIDDVVDVIQEEQEEDVLRLAGVAEDDLFSGVWQTARSRFTWLLVNLGTAVLASLVIGLFDATIEQMVALAVLMPIVASMGGNAGTQTLTVMVRALATRDVTPDSAMRVLGKETLVGIGNGVVFAILTGLVAWGWFGEPLVGGIIAGAMVFNMIVAAVAGATIPLVLDRMGIDPAIASTVFLTTVTDVVGFFSFLGLAALALG
ncbi:magnesium transporter [Magnetospira sp. QH-2]|uniref:magnesium transporter n=1 Tax=Magnetospira sp. (strain QH-2) TaxID=1288970 RepID=UPI0003E8185C|nr:magnesium transporter [Magnetospira sp. QH-2]CCQ74046.1 Putative magnesium transporter MgtE.[mgtE] [Magnetospira sp. QH-2]